MASSLKLRAAAMFLLVLPAAAIAEDDLSLPTPPATPAEDTFQGRASVEAFWKSKGASDAAAKGIADRVGVESSFNPGASGDANSSFGLYQHHLERRDAVMRRLMANAENDQAFAEFLGADKTAAAHWQEIKTAKDEKTAYLLFTRYFERPAGTPVEPSPAQRNPARPRASKQRSALAIAANHPVPGPPGAPPGVTAPTGSGAWWQQMLAAHGHGGGSPYIASAPSPTTAATTYTTPPRVPSTTVSSLPQTSAVLALAAFLHHRK